MEHQESNLFEYAEMILLQHAYLGGQMAISDWIGGRKVVTFLSLRVASRIYQAELAQLSLENIQLVIKDVSDLKAYRYNIKVQQIGVNSMKYLRVDLWLAEPHCIPRLLQNRKCDVEVVMSSHIVLRSPA